MEKYMIRCDRIEEVVIPEDLRAISTVFTLNRLNANNVEKVAGFFLKEDRPTFLLDVPKEVWYKDPGLVAFLINSLKQTQCFYITVDLITSAAGCVSNVFNRVKYNFYVAFERLDEKTFHQFHYIIRFSFGALNPHNREAPPNFMTICRYPTLGFKLGVYEKFLLHGFSYPLIILLDSRMNLETLSPIKEIMKDSIFYSYTCGDAQHRGFVRQGPFTLDDPTPEAAAEFREIGRLSKLKERPPRAYCPPIYWETSRQKKSEGNRLLKFLFS